MADDVDLGPTTLIFPSSDRRLLVSDDYEQVVSRINLVGHDPNPIIRVTPVGGEEIAIYLAGTIIIVPGDRREDFELPKP